MRASCCGDRDPREDELALQRIRVVGYKKLGQHFGFRVGRPVR